VITPTHDVFHSAYTPITKMPRLYLIVRFDTSDSSQPSYNTTDITITGVPAALSDDPTRIFSTYTVIDEEDPGGPWIYRVAVEIVKVAKDNVHISYGTLSYDDALQRLQDLPHHIRESDKERVQDEANVKAEVVWADAKRLKAKLRKGRFLWYELVEVDAENRANWKAHEDADRGVDKKRRRVEVEEAVGGDYDIFEDEEDDDEMDME
jgi:hypothetical protein